MFGYSRRYMLVAYATFCDVERVNKPDEIGRKSSICFCRPDEVDEIAPSGNDAITN